MRTLLTTLTILLSAAIASPQSTGPHGRSISFPALKASPSRCLPLKAQFLDNATLLVSNPICAKAGVESSQQHALASLDGAIRSSIELGQGSRYAYIGPPGFIFFPADHQGWLIYDTGLHPKGILPIRSGEFPGSIVLSPTRVAVALSSDAPGSHTGLYHWQLLSGEPLTKTGEYTGVLPFPGITDSGNVETAPSKKAKLKSDSSSTGEWFFDIRHQLTRRADTSIEVQLPEAAWLAPPDSPRSWCSQVVSTGEPRHILAHCHTEHYLPRVIGGFLTHGLPLYNLRYIVYDTAGSILIRGEYPFDSPPSLSPDGHLLAVTQKSNVILYDLR